MVGGQLVAAVSTPAQRIRYGTQKGRPGLISTHDRSPRHRQACPRAFTNACKCATRTMRTPARRKAIARSSWATMAGSSRNKTRVVRGPQSARLTGRGRGSREDEGRVEVGGRGRGRGRGSGSRSRATAKARLCLGGRGALGSRRRDWGPGSCPIPPSLVGEMVEALSVSQPQRAVPAEHRAHSRILLDRAFDGIGRNLVEQTSDTVHHRVDHRRLLHDHVGQNALDHVGGVGTVVAPVEQRGRERRGVRRAFGPSALAEAPPRRAVRDGARRASRSGTSSDKTLRPDRAARKPTSRATSPVVSSGTPGTSDDASSRSRVARGHPPRSSTSAACCARHPPGLRRPDAGAGAMVISG